MIQVRELELEVPGRRLLSGASFTVPAGEKAGLVGPNGAGKSTLLKVLSGQADPAHGLVAVKGALGHVPQDPRPRGVDLSTHGVMHVLSARGLDAAATELEELRLALERTPSESAVGAFAEAEESYRAAGGYSADSEARRLLAGLGLAPDRADLPLSALSGGERRRVEMARVLFGGSDVLLLDEPTNHLDKEAKTWLMGFLRAYRGALIVVSHDLELLDTAITRVLHIDHGKLREYRGTYSQYRKARQQEEERMAKTAVRQEAEIRRLTTLADVMRRQTQKRARTAKSLDKRVARLRSQQVAAPRREKKYAIKFPDPPHAGRLALEASNLTKGYGAPPVFDDISFRLENGQRLLVMGFNGAGKTTLLRILAAQSQPDGGSYRLGTGVNVGYYAQEHEGINPGQTALEHMLDASPEPEPRLRSLLGMFGLTGDHATRDARHLSGGEKTKLALTQLVAGKHNLLLLDEPTNNLDPPSRAAVGEALAAWPGTMIVVSHDPEFVERLRPQRALLMPEGQVEFWDDEMLDLVALA
ncbi:MAG TPA: ABC-F family ATP-binding cassette domain-containing protein [Candidatus Dormibacteraeota bacterium]